MFVSNHEKSHGMTAERGGGGCRCRFCRRQRSWRRKPHWRTVVRERAIRRAVQTHPRNT